MSNMPPSPVRTPERPGQKKGASALWGSLRPFREGVAASVGGLGQSLGGVFFVPSPWLGLLLWAALLSHPRHAMFALWGLLVGMLIKAVLRVSEAPGPGGGIKANALLAAVVTGWMSAPTDLPVWSQLALAAGAAASAAFVAAALMRVLSRSELPALLWGYCLVAVMLFAICADCTVQAAATLPAWPVPGDLTEYTLSFLRAMGSLMYAPEPLAGALVSLAIVLWSRSAFVCGVVAWIAGAWLAERFVQLQLVYYWLPLSYNFFIAGMALGAVLFLPGRLALPLAALGGGMTAFLALAVQYVFEWSAASYLPIASALTIWIGMGALSLAGERAIVWRNLQTDQVPEQRWWTSAFWAERFGPAMPLLSVPLPGVMAIGQGFGGPITHQGMHVHALDFQRSGESAVEVSIWGLPVHSPAPGMVERVLSAVPDNALGGSNYAQNWGNHVVIRLDAGGWLMLAHLQKDSVAVAPGQRVEIGTHLGLAGNSGRSAVAHLHMQVQSSAQPGSPTRPFRLANYLSGDIPAGPLLRWVAAGVPREGELVMRAEEHLPTYNTLVGMAPGQTVWTVQIEGLVPWRFRPHMPAQIERVRMDVDQGARQVFSTEGGSRLVACLDPDAWRVAELRAPRSPLFRLLALAAPVLPYAARPGVYWHDLPPVDLPGGPWHSLVLPLAPYFRKAFMRASCECVATSDAGGVLELVTQLSDAPSGMPRQLVCQFAPMRGPVRLRAEFDAGSVEFTQLSFEPISYDPFRS